MAMQLRRVEDGWATTPTERLALVESFMGRNATAAYRKCRTCQEQGLDHQLAYVTEAGEGRVQHILCARCWSRETT
eukprot:1798144-Rhodomonas_salina.1